MAWRIVSPVRNRDRWVTNARVGEESKAAMGGDEVSRMTVEAGAVVDVLPGLVWTTTSDGVGNFFNRRWRDYSGLAAEAACGRGWQSAIHPGDLEPLVEAFAAIQALEVAREIEGRLRRFDGEYRWFVFRLSPLPDRTNVGRLWCWFAMETDEISTSPDRPMLDGRLRRLMDMLPAQVLLMTPSMELEFVNREVREFYGRPLEELNHCNSSGDIHPDDLPGTFERVERLLKFGEPWDFQNRMRRADGTYRWVRSRMVPSLDAQGNIVRYCAVQTDVHDLKQAKDLLAGEVRLLEMVALGRPLLKVLDVLSRLAEELAVGSFCSILIVSPDRKHFRVGAGPSLPDGYNAILHGKTIDPSYDPCSLAAIEKTTIITADTQNDPRWTSSIWPSLMREHEFGACWSMPIMSVSGQVSGIFAVYWRGPAGPTPDEQELFDRFTKIAGIAIDRAQADAALAEREADLQRAHIQLSEGQRLSKTGSFTADLHLDQHSWSEELYRIFEFDPATSPSVQATRDRVHPADQPQFDSAIRRGIAGADIDFLYRIVTPEAGVRHLRCAARVIEHIAGRPILMGTVQDITESTLAGTALAAQATELRQAQRYLIEAQRLSRTGSFTWDVFADEHIWSDEIRRIFGFDPDIQVTAGMIQAAVHPDDLAEVARVIDGAVEGRDFDLLFRILTADGKVRHAHVVGHRIKDITDRPTFVGALQDVTESKVIEEALRASEAELRRANSYLAIAQRLSKTGSYIWDLGKNERQWSEEMYRIFDLDPETSTPSAMTHELIHPEDLPIIEAQVQCAREGREFDGEFRLMMPGGAIKTLHSTGRLIDRTEDGPIYVGAAQDVTERILAEERLDRARRELAHVSRVTTLSALTASIAHEVNQPLAGIITNASTGLRLLAADPPNTAGAVATAQRTLRDANRAAEVIKRLRALFSRRPAASEPLDLDDAAAEVLALASSELEGACVVLHTDLSGNLPAIVGDRVQLQQVILNLVLNAADAMKAVDDRPRDLSISTARDGDGHLRLSVRDVGVGAKAEQLARLFDAFYTTKPEGMGVGLFISRSIIEAHGGRIRADANDGPGLTLSFSIPVTASPLASAAGGDDRAPSGGGGADLASGKAW